MTATDRAFIRAYETDEKNDTPGGTYLDSEGVPATVPMPHVAFPLAELTTREDIARENLLAVSPVGNRDGKNRDKLPSKTERRPLSTFVPSEQAEQEGFKPAMEVDGFRWPAVCDRLAHQHQTLLAPVVDRLLTAADEGQSLVGFLGAEPDAGCTSMLLSVARLLATKGKTVAIVDGEFYKAAQSSSPDLAGHLGVAVACGWEDVLAGRVPLAEGVIRSLGDGISILPLAGRGEACEPFRGIQASVTAGVLRYHFDLVLFDLGCAADERQAAAAQTIIQHCRLDATLLVTSAPNSTATMQQAITLATAPETICLGVLENKIVTVHEMEEK